MTAPGGKECGDRSTPLHCACTSNSLELITALLDGLHSKGSIVCTLTTNGPILWHPSSLPPTPHPPHHQRPVACPLAATPFAFDDVRDRLHARLDTRRRFTYCRCAHMWQITANLHLTDSAGQTALHRAAEKCDDRWPCCLWAFEGAGTGVLLL